MDSKTELRASTTLQHNSASRNSYRRLLTRLWVIAVRNGYSEIIKEIEIGRVLND